MTTKSQKQKENKNRLVDFIISDLRDNMYKSYDYIFDLVRESLNKRTQKDLRGITGLEESELNNILKP